jgi:hypothetical protein
MNVLSNKLSQAANNKPVFQTWEQDRIVRAQDDNIIKPSLREEIDCMVVNDDSPKLHHILQRIQDLIGSFNQITNSINSKKRRKKSGRKQTNKQTKK